MARRPSTPRDAAKPAAGGARGAARPGPDPVTDPALLRTQRICRLRARRERDTSISRLVGDLARQTQRDLERTGAAAEAWQSAMPPAIVADTWIEQSGGAQLVIGVPSASVAYAVDRALRMGALAAIRLRLQSPGLRVRTRVGMSPDAGPDGPAR